MAKNEIQYTIITVLGMDKNVLEAKIRNGKWVKQPQEPKSFFILANSGEKHQGEKYDLNNRLMTQ